MTYALCGFANFGSLGIMLGGLSALLPAERRAELAELGMKSIFAGLLSTCVTAALVGSARLMDIAVLRGDRVILRGWESR